MNKEIVFYRLNGDIEIVKELNTDNLENINGMMTRCTLKDGRVIIGYADPFRTYERETFDNEVHDYIYLWTFDNLDEKTHKLIGDDENRYKQTYNKVIIDELMKVESIIYSNPRWGGKLTNKFTIN